MSILLQINVSVNYGSTGRIVEEIGKIAIRRGWFSYVACGRYIRKSESHVIKIGNNVDLLYHLLISRLFDRHAFGSKIATKKLINTIKALKPDIIHLHNIHGYYVNIELLFKYLKESNIYVVWTLHDCWPFTGHCAYFDRIGCNKWTKQCKSCDQINEYPKSWILDNSYKNYLYKKEIFNSIDKLRIICVSNWLKSKLQESFLSSIKNTTIYNGIDINCFMPCNNIDEIKNKYSVKNRFILLGIASVWDNRKGLKDFIELSRYIDNNTVIILIGLKSKQLKKLPKNIIGLKKIESISELSKIYSIADLFLNLTYEDNFPSTNIESLACGTPILTYNTGGSIEAVTEETGFVVEKGDISSIQKVISIIKCRSKESYINACRTRAINFFNKDDRYNEYINLYENLIKIEVA